jgi:hypothetical protein
VNPVKQPHQPPRLKWCFLDFRLVVMSDMFLIQIPDFLGGLFGLRLFSKWNVANPSTNYNK